MGQGQYSDADIASPAQMGQYSDSDVDTTPVPGVADKVKGALSSIWDSLPTTQVGQVAQHIADWANQKAAQNRQENLAAVAQGQTPPHSEITNSSLGMLGSAGQMAHGATTPQGVATTLGAIVAPEVVGPALVAHGMVTAAKNAPAALAGNPDAAQAALGGAAEATGGAAVAGEAPPLSSTLTGRVTQGVAQATGLAAPEAVPSMMRAIKPTNAKTDFPSTLASAGPDLAAHAQASGAPITDIKSLVDAIPEAKKNIWAQYQAKLGPNANVTVDGNAVADAMVNSIDARTRAQNPNLVDKIESVADTYRKPMTLADTEDYLQSANNDLASYYAKNKVGQQVAAKDPETGHVVAEANALRQSLYNTLDQFSGPGAADLKQRYGALSDLQQEALRRKNVADRQSQTGTMASVGRIAGAGRMVKGATSMLQGHGLGVDLPEMAGGAAQVALGNRLSNLNNTDWLINNAFNGPKAFAPRGAVPSVAPQAGSAIPPGVTPISGASQVIGKSPFSMQTDSLGVRWAKDPNGVMVSVPKSVADSDLPAYVKQKLSEQVTMRNKYGFGGQQ